MSGATVGRTPVTDPSGDCPEAIAAVLADLGIGLRDAASAEVGGQARRGGLIIGVDEVQMTRSEDIRLIGDVFNHLNTAHPAAAVAFVAAGWQHGADTEPVSAARAQAILHAAPDRERCREVVLARRPRTLARRSAQPHHRRHC